MKYRKEEYQDLLSLSINRAHNSIKHFMDLLDIDSELFIDLFKTNILIDYEKMFVNDEECSIAFMGNKTDDACIYIGIDYLNNELDKISETNKKQSSINSISTSIIHELLHINRGIIINNVENRENLYNLNANTVLDNKLNTSLYDKLLNDSIKCNFYNFFDDIIPLKISSNNELYDVVAYSKKDNSYIFYNNEYFSFNKKNEPLIYVGLELNSDKFIHNPSFKYSLNKNDNNSVLDPADYIHQNNNDSLNDKKDKLTYQSSFEETLVETISQMIIKCRKNNYIDFNSLTEYFKSCGIVEETLMFKIIKCLGNEFIKWFLFSSRKEYYDDKLYSIFNNKYNSILKSFNELREATLKKKNYSFNEINNINDILEEKVIRR